MRQKIGTILEKSLIKRLRLLAAREGKPINRLIEEALRFYLNFHHHEGRRSLVKEGWGTFRVTSKQLKEALEEDIFES